MQLAEEGLYHACLDPNNPLSEGASENVNQTPYVQANWHITHIARDGKWVEITEPLERFSRWFVTDKTMNWTQDKLLRLGFNGDMTNQAFDASPNPITEGVVLECKHRVWNEKVRENWDLQSEAQSKKTGQWDIGVKRLFKAKYDQARSKHTREQAPATPDVPINPDITDDEIPGGLTEEKP